MNALLDMAVMLARIMGEEHAVQQGVREIRLHIALMHLSEASLPAYSAQYAKWREHNPAPAELREVPAHAAKFVEAMGYVGEHAQCAGLFVLWRAWDDKREGGLHRLAELYAEVERELASSVARTRPQQHSTKKSRRG